MLFTEFLINKKFVQPEQLVKALLAQLQTQPAPAEISLRYGLMSAEQILNVYHTQSDADASFLSTARKLGYLDDRKVSEIESHSRNSRRPLGAILVELGYTDSDKFVRIADDYLATVNSAGNVTHKVDLVPRHTSGSVESVNSRDGSSLGDERVSRSAMQEAYLEGFGEAQRDELESMFIFIGAWGRIEGDDQRAIFDFVKKRIHILLGSARFAELPISEQLFLSVEKCMQAVELANSRGISVETFSQLKVLSSEALRLAWHLRDNVYRTASEAASESSANVGAENVMRKFEKFLGTLVVA